MQFNDTTNKNGLIQRIEDYTNLGDGVISGDSTLLKKVTADVNETVYDLTTELMLLQDSFDWDDPYKTDYPIATTSLVANQRDYQFDSISFLKLKRVDISYDGVNYYRATAFDSASFEDGLGNDSTTDALFDKTKPHYDPKAFGFWLYPMADATDVSNGGKIRIEYSRGHTEYDPTDTDKEPPIDRPFHDLIAMGAAAKWAIRKSEPNAGNLLSLYEQGKAKMVQHYDQRNEDSFISMKNTFIDSYK
jgi:hypothetical protein